VFMVLAQTSSPGSFDECRLSAGWPPTQVIYVQAYIIDCT